MKEEIGMADAPPKAAASAEKAYTAVTETKPLKFSPKAKPGSKKASIAEAPVAEPVNRTEPGEIAAPVNPAAPDDIAAPIFDARPDRPFVDPDISQLKDPSMDAHTNDFTNTTTSTPPSGGLKDVFSDVKAKAKAAFDKGTASLGDATEFAKGNVEAVVESGKIYAAGLQDLGSNYAAESKLAFETLTADVKELAAQKTPVDFFKLQTELAKKNFENAVAFGTKSSEAWLKLASDTFAPLSGRVSLAVEKIKATA